MKVQGIKMADILDGAVHRNNLFSITIAVGISLGWERNITAKALSINLRGT